MKARLAVPAVLLVFTAAFISCKNKPPAVPETPAGATSGRTGTACIFSSSATDPEGDSVALRFDWSDADTSVWSVWLTPADTCFATHAWAAAGTFEVHAQAKDIHEALSDWSSALTVAISDTFNQPPTVQAPSGQDSGFIGVAYRFFPSATDPDGDSIYLRLCCDHGDTTAWQGPLPSGTSLAFPDSWDTSGTHWVCAQAKDSHGAMSPWSPNHWIAISIEGTIKWMCEIYGEVIWFTCPVIGPDGTIYIGGDDGFQAVNPDGTLRWRVPFDANSSPAMGADGTIYVGGRDSAGRFMGAFTTAGTDRWRFRLPEDPLCGPGIGPDGTLYFSVFYGPTYALNPDGTLKWCFDGQSWSSCAVGPDGTMYTGAYVDSLFAFNPDGTVKWRIRAWVDWYSALAIGSDGTLYFGDGWPSGYLRAVNPEGTDKWRCPLPGYFGSPPAIGLDGTIYIGGEYGDMYAVSPDGTLKWTYKTHFGEVAATPAVRADGVIVFTAAAGEVCAVNPDGTPRWRLRPYGEVHTSPVTIAPDGTVLFWDLDGYLEALHGSSPLADSPWPKFQRDLQNTGRLGGRR